MEAMPRKITRFDKTKTASEQDCPVYDPERYVRGICTERYSDYPRHFALVIIEERKTICQRIARFYLPNDITDEQIEKLDYAQYFDRIGVEYECVPDYLEQEKILVMPREMLARHGKRVVVYKDDLKFI